MGGKAAVEAAETVVTKKRGSAVGKATTEAVEKKVGNNALKGTGEKVALGAEKKALGNVTKESAEFLGENANKVLSNVEKRFANSAGREKKLYKHVKDLGFKESPQQAQKMLPKLEAKLQELMRNADLSKTKIGRFHDFENCIFYISEGKMVITTYDGVLVSIIDKTSNNWYANYAQYLFVK